VNPVQWPFPGGSTDRRPAEPPLASDASASATDTASGFLLVRRGLCSITWRSVSFASFSCASDTAYAVAFLQSSRRSVASTMRRNPLSGGAMRSRRAPRHYRHSIFSALFPRSNPTQISAVRCVRAFPVPADRRRIASSLGSKTCQRLSARSISLSCGIPLNFESTVSIFDAAILACCSNASRGDSGVR
jgi:hypothetical protein